MNTYRSVPCLTKYSKSFMVPIALYNTKNTKKEEPWHDKTVSFAK